MVVSVMTMTSGRWIIKAATRRTGTNGRSNILIDMTTTDDEDIDHDVSSNGNDIQLVLGNEILKVDG